MLSKDELKVPAFMRLKKSGKRKKASSVKKTSKKRVVKPKKKSIAKRRPTSPKRSSSRKRAKPVKKSALKKVKPKKVAKIEKAKKIKVGEITHYFDKIKVAIILLEKPIKQSQPLEFEGLNNFNQTISSMQFNHKEIKSAKKGQEIGIKIKKPLKTGDKVYLSK